MRVFEIRTLRRGSEKMYFAGTVRGRALSKCFPGSTVGKVGLAPAATHLLEAKEGYPAHGMYHTLSRHPKFGLGTILSKEGRGVVVFTRQ